MCFDPFGDGSLTSAVLPSADRPLVSNVLFLGSLVTRVAALLTQTP